MRVDRSGVSGKRRFVQNLHLAHAPCAGKKKAAEAAPSMGKIYSRGALHKAAAFRAEIAQKPGRSPSPRAIRFTGFAQMA